MDNFDVLYKISKEQHIYQILEKKYPEYRDGRVQYVSINLTKILLIYQK